LFCTLILDKKILSVEGGEYYRKAGICQSLEIRRSDLL